MLSSSLVCASQQQSSIALLNLGNFKPKQQQQFEETPIPFYFTSQVEIIDKNEKSNDKKKLVPVLDQSFSKKITFAIPSINSQEPVQKVEYNIEVSENPAEDEVLSFSLQFQPKAKVENADYLVQKSDKELFEPVEEYLQKEIQKVSPKNESDDEDSTLDESTDLDIIYFEEAKRLIFNCTPHSASSSEPINLMQEVIVDSIDKEKLKTGAKKYLNHRVVSEQKSRLEKQKKRKWTGTLSNALQYMKKACFEESYNLLNDAGSLKLSLSKEKLNQEQPGDVRPLPNDVSDLFRIIQKSIRGDLHNQYLIRKKELDKLKPVSKEEDGHKKMYM
jgi:hypothetical protein